ncbi:MAG: GFA family protein [Rhizobiaceae bacterium]
MSKEASCSCGALRTICDGTPELVSLCHCNACQKRTGAPFGIAAFFLRNSVRMEGDYKSYQRMSDSGNQVTFNFCVNCGSTVFWETSRKPDFVAVAVGAFTDAGFPKPSKEVHTDCRHHWIEPL